MKLIVESPDGKKNLELKTSRRADKFSIKIYKKDNKYDREYSNWGHLNKKQAHRLIRELGWYSRGYIYVDSLNKRDKIGIDCDACGNYKPLKSFTQNILKKSNLERCNTCEDKMIGKFHSGNAGIYKHSCIENLRKLKIGDSMMIYDRTKEVIRGCWLWRANCIGLSRVMKKGSNLKYNIESLDKYTHKVTRVEEQYAEQK